MRNNEDRFNFKEGHEAPPLMVEEQKKSFQFAVPTEIVELPSEGKYYPEGHMLHGLEQIELKHMTAKEEDILTSKTLLKKGLAFDKLLQNLIQDKKINSRWLLDADRTALLIEARKSGFGELYETQTTCPSCGELVNVETDLEENVFYNKEQKTPEELNVEMTPQKTFLMNLPRLKLQVEFRLLTGEDDSHLFKISEKQKKHKKGEKHFTNRLKQIIVAVEGDTDKGLINQFVNAVSLYEARLIMDVYSQISPSVVIEGEVSCNECDYDGLLEVPITKDFFWPE